MCADVSQTEWNRFSATVERHAPHMYDYCLALLADRYAAADAARTTLVIAYSLFDRLQDAGRVRTWLLALARRECRGSHPVRSELFARDPGSAFNEPAAEPRTTGTGQMAGAVLSALPAVEREILDLVYRHYLGAADVAAVLGESAEHAKMLLANAVRSFEHATEHLGDDIGHGAQYKDRLLSGVRAISAIPIAALPPLMLAGTLKIVTDPAFASYRESLASTIGNLGSDGFPVAHSDPELPGIHRVPWDKVLAHARKTAILEKTGHIPRRRLLVLGGVVLALVAGFVAIASNSSGVPGAISRAMGPAFGQDPAGPPRASARRLPGPLPITALLPSKHHNGTVLPVLPLGQNGRRPSRKPHPGPPPVTTPPVTASSTPTPSSPSPTPSSPSPTPSSPSPTPSSPSPTPTVSP